MPPRARCLLAALMLLAFTACGGGEQSTGDSTEPTPEPASKTTAPTPTVGGLRVTTTVELGTSTTRRVNSLQWRPHDCLAGNFEDRSTTAAITPCAKVHDWEVSSVVTDMTQSLGIQGPEFTDDDRQAMSAACQKYAQTYLPGLVLESPYSRYAGMTLIPTHESWVAGDRRLACLIAPHSRDDLSQPPRPVQSTGAATAPTVETLPTGTCVNMSPQGWQVVGCAATYTHQVVGDVPVEAELMTQLQTCFGIASAAQGRSLAPGDIELLPATKDAIAAGLTQLPCVVRIA